MIYDEKNTTKRFVLVAMVIFWTMFIFYNSSQPYKLSDARSLAIANMIRKQVPAKNVQNTNKTQQQSSKSNETNKIQQQPQKVTVSNKDKLDYFVRKNAHAFEYFILAVITSLTFKAFNFKYRKVSIYIAFMCILTAVLDESYQILIPGRNSSTIDVLIDFAGSFIAILIFLAIEKFYQQKRLKIH